MIITDKEIHLDLGLPFGDLAIQFVAFIYRVLVDATRDVLILANGQNHFGRAPVRANLSQTGIRPLCTATRRTYGLAHLQFAVRAWSVCIRF